MTGHEWIRKGYVLLPRCNLDPSLNPSRNSSDRNPIDELRRSPLASSGSLTVLMLRPGPVVVVVFRQVTDEQFKHRVNRFPRDPPATKEVRLHYGYGSWYGYGRFCTVWQGRILRQRLPARSIGDETIRVQYIHVVFQIIQVSTSRLWWRGNKRFSKSNVQHHPPAKFLPAKRKSGQGYRRFRRKTFS